QVQPHVAHHGVDQGVRRQLPGFLHRQGQHHHDRVTVDDPPVGVDGQAAVGVTVVGQAEVRPVGDHRGTQRLHVGGAAVVVDVQAVRLGVDRDDVGAGRAVGAGRGQGGGPVRAVDDDGQRVEPGGGGLAHVAQVALQRVLGVDDAADARPGGPATGPLVHQFLDAVLGGVVQFVPAGSEDLDAVVGHRVVRRGDHHAEVGVIG